MKRRKLDLRTNNTNDRNEENKPTEIICCVSRSLMVTICLEDRAFLLLFYLHADPPIGGGGLTCSRSSLKLPP